MSAVENIRDADEAAGVEPERVKEPSPAAPPPVPAQPPFEPKPFHIAAIYASASILLGVTQGLGVNLVTANITGIQGSLGATQTESNWLIAAYMATNVTGTMLLYKFRTQFGLRLFGELGLILFVIVTAAHLFSNDLRSAIAVRAALGVAAAPLSTLAFFYMLEWLPPAKRLTIGICFGMLGAQMAAPFARVISPDLLEIGQWHGLYFLEMGLALICLAIVFTLPLTHPPRMKMFDKVDLISFPLIGLGMGSLAIVLSTGRFYWWLEAPWIGVMAAVGIAALTILALIELHREHPIIDLRWLSSIDMLVFAGALTLFRLLLSEQTTGAVGFFNAIGLLNDQMVTLFWVVTLATAAGYAFVSRIISLERMPAIHLVALAMIATAAFMDARATNLTRPEQLYVSQGMIAFAGAMFLPPAMLFGFTQALKRGGPKYILSFLVVFITTQTIGGLLGSAVLGSFVTIREKFHSNMLSQTMTLTDPLVANRVQQLGSAYGKVITDPAIRNAEGIALLGQQVTREATVLAYNDLYLMIAGAAVLGMIALLVHLAIDFRRTHKAAPHPQTA